VGVLTEDEAARRIAEEVSTVDNAMFRHVLTGTPDMTVAEAASLLQGRPEGALPVMEGRRLVGIVTLSDLLDVLAAPKAPAAPSTDILIPSAGAAQRRQRVRAAGHGRGSRKAGA
jgi:CBS domain-containing protein